MILISNDDSIYSKGIAALVEIARQFDKEIVVVAPQEVQSAKSHSVSLLKPISCRKLDLFGKDIQTYSVTGTPADCIKLALNVLLDRKPDLVLSGINHGGNFSVNLIYSGTVAAVVEAAMHRIPSIALSVDSHDDDLDFTAAIKYGTIIIDKMLKQNNEIYCLNVNVPYIPVEQIKGIRVCKQTSGVWFEDFDEVDIENICGKSFFLKGRYHNYEPESTNTDVWAIENGFVAVVPVKTDWTDYQMLSKLNYLNI